MSLSKRVRFMVLVRDNYTCRYCGAHPPDTVLEIDHVIPRCKGGTDDMGNLATACWNCNRGKSGMALTQKWELVAGENGEQGPRCGEIVDRVERFPAYWVYECNGSFHLFPDEIDADLWLSEWEQKLKWGVPGLRRGFPSQVAVSDEWDAYILAGAARHEGRRLAGFYLPLDPELNGTNCVPALGWFPGASAFDCWLTIHTARTEDGA